MDRIGRVTIIFATVLLSWGESFPCRAQPPALLPAASRPAPPPARDDQAMKRKPAPLQADRTALTAPCRSVAGRDARRLAPWAEGSSLFEQSRLCLSTAERIDLADGARATIPPPRQFGQPNPSTAPSSSPSALAPPSGDPSLRLKPAPLEPTDLGFPINLATALRLSDARPLIVAAAQARVWVAEAQLTRAKVLWVPTLMFGADYIRHDGGGPDFNKGIMTRAERELLPGWWRLRCVLSRCISVFEPDRCLLRAAGRTAGPEFPASGHPDRQERLAAHDSRRLLQRAPVPGIVCRCPLRRRAGARPGRSDLAPEQGSGPQGRGRSGQEHARRPRATSDLRRARCGACTAPT